MLITNYDSFFTSESCTFVVGKQEACWFIAVTHIQADK
jgi:hypothetical protein